jgi:hypothetical protein
MCWACTLETPGRQEPTALALSWLLAREWPTCSQATLFLAWQRAAWEAMCTRTQTQVGAVTDLA